MSFFKKNNIYNHIEFYILLTVCLISYIKRQVSLGIFLSCMIIFLLYFHRNPDYKISDLKDNILYSPAQGKILDIRQGNTMTKISIFLSIFDNHTQCIPITCTKVDEIFTYGNFYFAQKIEGSEYNQKLKHILKSKFGNIEIIQYTGFFTRRIYSLSSDRDKLYKIGDKLGYIRFGSRVDIYVPKEIINTIYVKKGIKIDMLQPIMQLKSK
jgi:phosphatidylserine decarboxylase